MMNKQAYDSNTRGRFQNNTDSIMCVCVFFTIGLITYLYRSICSCLKQEKKRPKGKTESRIC